MRQLHKSWFVIFICLVISHSVANAQTEAELSNEALRDTLVLLLSFDIGQERFTNELKALKDTPLSGLIDSVHGLPTPEQRKFAAKKFMEIINRSGLPTAQEIGNGKAMEALLVLTLHSGDAIFIKKNIPLLKSSFAPKSIAVLEDKLCVLENKPQIYGSQVEFSVEKKRLVFYPIENPSKVHGRRNEVGLNTLEAYAKETGVNWNLEKHSFLEKGH